ncbi:MAG: hypothetical protein PHS93_00185 [Candidatus Omnitrophica bacterium]|nr:hypothetical protein [Candidatus Omnitrophota bacterium]MDD5351577.1 hypothetical protein [Candidatus Omnitrophota bacterium]MDD5551012.1 hypothetical protein [Candidatus Omnitrophota bacterium]
MMKKYAKRASLSFVLLAMVLFFAGCETLKGAAQGLKKDWDNWTKYDKEFQRALW